MTLYPVPRNVQEICCQYHQFAWTQKQKEKCFGNNKHVLFLNSNYKIIEQEMNKMATYVIFRHVTIHHSLIICLVQVRSFYQTCNDTSFTNYKCLVQIRFFYRTCNDSSFTNYICLVQVRSFYQTCNDSSFTNYICLVQVRSFYCTCNNSSFTNYICLVQVRSFYQTCNDSSFTNYICLVQVRSFYQTCNQSSFTNYICLVQVRSFYQTCNDSSFTNYICVLQVRSFYRTCNGRASCNCAITVKSGDDVILIDRCGAARGASTRKTRISVKIFKNGELTKNTRILQFADGKRYEVSMEYQRNPVLNCILLGWGFFQTFTAMFFNYLCFL